MGEHDDVPTHMTCSVVSAFSLGPRMNIWDRAKANQWPRAFQLCPVLGQLNHCQPADTWENKDLLETTWVLGCFLTHFFVFVVWQ